MSSGKRRRIAFSKRTPITRKRWLSSLLLDAFVLPGSGHFLAGYRVLGTVMALLTITFLVVALVHYSSAYFQALFALPRNAELIPKILAASSLAMGQKIDIIRPSLYSILFLWSFGVLDLLLRVRMEIGRKVEEEAI
jgi:hypothetical protein